MAWSALAAPCPPDLTLPAVQRFDVGDLGEGEHRLSARLVPEDSLPQDDAYFALVRRVQPRVLLIAATPNGDDAVYLRAALQSLENPQLQCRGYGCSGGRHAVACGIRCSGGV